MFDNANAASNYRKAYEHSITNISKAKSLEKLGSVYFSREEKKANAIFYDAIGYLVKSLKEETNLNLSPDSFITACYTKESKIYDYMSEELRSITEEVVYWYIATLCFSRQIDYSDYEYYMELLVEAGNRYAHLMQKGY